MVAHSKEDEVVPYESGKRLYNKIKGEKYFHDLTGYHNYPTINPNYYDEVYNEVFN